MQNPDHIIVQDGYIHKQTDQTYVLQINLVEDRKSNQLKENLLKVKL